MKRLFLSTLAAGLTCASGFAQLPSLSGGAGGMTPGTDFAVLSKIFGKNTAFTARADVRVVDKNQKETISLPMDFAMLDGKIRIEIDATRLKNTALPPGAIDALKQMGLEKLVTLIRSDRKTMYVIYPKISSYLTMPMEQKDVESVGKSSMKSEKLGDETIAGHPCVKNKVTITSEKNETQELTVWNASDLRDFPIQTVAKQKDDTVTTRYLNVQFERPDAKDFEPPADYEKYDGLESFMAGMLKRALGGGTPTAEGK